MGLIKRLTSNGGPALLLQRGGESLRAHLRGMGSIAMSHVSCSGEHKNLTKFQQKTFLLLHLDYVGFEGALRQ